MLLKVCALAGRAFHKDGHIMRLLHTADWHLGHHLHGHDRSFEQGCFLDWLSELIRVRQIDGLLVAGDVFDTANPSAASWQLFYRFLARLRAEVPHLNVVVIGGNHDSPSKLDAPHELLKAFELHLVGAISRHADGALDVERLIVPLKDKQGTIQAWCAAVPYLRSADLRWEEQDEEGDRLVAGVRALYREVLAAIEARRTPEQAVIALGHAYLVKGELSQLSERKVLGGNQHALPLDIFTGADHVALGHLHLAQSPAPHIHYSGSPLPLSLAEADYHHQVLELALQGAEVTLLARHAVPRVVDMLRLPAEAAPLDEVVAQLHALNLPEQPTAQRPYLEVRLLLDKPEARVREKILAALADKPLRLARISTQYTGHGQAMADSQAHRQLDELTPEQVFRLCYARQHASEPSQELELAFNELVTQRQEGEA